MSASTADARADDSERRGTLFSTKNPRPHFARRAEKTGEPPSPGMASNNSANTPAASSPRPLTLPRGAVASRLAFFQGGQSQGDSERSHSSNARQSNKSSAQTIGPRAHGHVTEASRRPRSGTAPSPKLTRAIATTPGGLPVAQKGSGIRVANAVQHFQSHAQRRSGSSDGQSATPAVSVKDRIRQFVEPSADTKADPPSGRRRSSTIGSSSPSSCRLRLHADAPPPSESPQQQQQKQQQENVHTPPEDAATVQRDKPIGQLEMPASHPEKPAPRLQQSTLSHQHAQAGKEEVVLQAVALVEEGETPDDDDNDDDDDDENDDDHDDNEKAKDVRRETLYARGKHQHQNRKEKFSGAKGMETVWQYDESSNAMVFATRGSSDDGSGSAPASPTTVRRKSALSVSETPSAFARTEATLAEPEVEQQLSRQQDQDQDQEQRQSTVMGEVNSVVLCQSVVRGWLARRRVRRYRKYAVERTKVAREILDTENTYVSNIETLRDVFLDPLKEISEQKGREDIAQWCDEVGIKSLYNDITVIIGYNSIILRDLNSRLKDWSVTQSKLGDVFLKMASFLKAYTQYLNHYQRANTDALPRLRTDASLSRTIEYLKTDRCGNKGIKDFLIMPVQRIPRYRMLLLTLVKNTWSHHPDHADLMSALQKVTDVAESVERSQEDIDQMKLVGEVEKRFEFPKGSKHLRDRFCLVAPHRRFIGECSVLEIILQRGANSSLSNDDHHHRSSGSQSARASHSQSPRGGSGMQTRARKMLLFNDILIFAKPSAQPKLPKPSSVRGSRTSASQSGVLSMSSDSFKKITKENGTNRSKGSLASDNDNDISLNGISDGKLATHPSPPRHAQSFGNLPVPRSLLNPSGKVEQYSATAATTSPPTTAPPSLSDTIGISSQSSCTLKLDTAKVKLETVMPLSLLAEPKIDVYNDKQGVVLVTAMGHRSLLLFRRNQQQEWFTLLHQYTKEARTNYQTITSAGGVTTSEQDSKPDGFVHDILHFTDESRSSFDQGSPGPTRNSSGKWATKWKSKAKKRKAKSSHKETSIDTIPAVTSVASNDGSAASSSRSSYNTTTPRSVRVSEDAIPLRLDLSEVVAFDSKKKGKNVVSSPRSSPAISSHQAKQEDEESDEGSDVEIGSSSTVAKVVRRLRGGSKSTSPRSKTTTTDRPTRADPYSSPRLRKDSASQLPGRGAPDGAIPLGLRKKNASMRDVVRQDRGGEHDCGTASDQDKNSNTIPDGAVSDNDDSDDGGDDDLLAMLVDVAVGEGADNDTTSGGSSRRKSRKSGGSVREKRKTSSKRSVL
eukprot:TRINITY_DN92_c0_g8_i1.p1 TRINITY_DN92_c0_g8~~TRINITY_DN92_c0_g8_i1.p1  ORF type:complete len:1299 (-),score=298.85 TRINITY_DN92_c0_g8_i1:294-4190(-)